jgi:glutaredoxin
MTIHPAGGAAMISFLKIFLLLVFVFSLSSTAFPQIYQWKDKNGNVVFSDTPPPGDAGKKVKILKERERTVPQEEIRPQGEARKASGLPAEQPKEKREYRDIKVILYMTEWCPYSLKARAYLKSLGVNLTEYDVERDKSKKEEKVQKSGSKGVPVIDVEGIIVKGFSESSIKTAVEKRRNL